jgi:glutamate synthase (NADPH/NADH) large chain
MVDIEPLSASDGEWLIEILHRFEAATGSEVAGEILKGSDPLGAFVKVMPRDYRRVLEAIESAERDGRDVDEAIMAVSHG